VRLHDFLDYHAREIPAAEFALYQGLKVTYREAQDAVHQLANALLAEGLVVGDRIAILAKNSLEYALLYFACSKAGVVPVPLNYRLAPKEWHYVLADSQAKLLLAGPEFTAGIDQVRGELGEVKRFISIGGATPAGWESYANWVGSHGTEAPSVEIDPAHPVYQMYTSGTTGRPKGAIVTHHAVTSNVTQLRTGFYVDPGERYLIVVPLYHAAGASALFITTACGGSSYLQADFVPSEVVRALSEDHVALTTLVPAMIQAMLLMVPDIAKRTYDSLRQLAYGASPISEDTLRRALEVFRCNFVQGYGMTESTAVLTLLTPADHERALSGRPELLRSAGRPIVGTELRIIDSEGHPVGVGEAGEITARGPQLMQGYWNQPEATKRTLTDGWLHTDDVGRLDEEGYLYILDRVKDMIVSGGENVYPNEVENALFAHPAVADAAVIGVPDPRWGEAVKAIVVLRPEHQASEDELREFCRSHLAGFKVPKSIDFVPSLPRNATGKVLKTELREPYWKGHDRRVS